MAASPIPATGVGWDTAIPDDAQVHGNDYNEHRETKLAMQIRLNKEHVALGASSAGGEHKPGSARIYRGDYSSASAGDNLPTTKPDGSTALDSNDAGMLAHDTDATYGKYYEWNGTGWAGVSLAISNLPYKDEDNMASDSASHVPTQQSVKAYADARGKVIQVVYTQSGAVNTGTTTIPVDDTIPQNTEGTEFITQAVTPVSATNVLEIKVHLNLSSSVVTRHIIAALFQDTTANALCVASIFTNNANAPMGLDLIYKMTAGTTSATTFKIRAGLDAAGTITYNGHTGARKFGGVFLSSITITEYEP